MTDQPASPIRPMGLFIWLLAAFFFLYEFFLRSFVGSVAQQVMPALHLNVETFALMSAGYFIAYGMMQLPVGILVDRWGVRLNMTIAVLVCVAGTALFSFSSGFWTAFASRVLMGLGSSFAFICLLVVALTWFPVRFFAFFAGISQFIGTIGPMLAGGPLVVWMLHENLGWRSALSIVALVGLALAILIALFVKNKPKEGRQALIMLNMPAPLRLRLLGLLKNPQAWFVAFYTAAIYVSMSLLGVTWGTSFLQAEGLAQTVAASMVSIAWFGYALGCPMIGALSDIAKRRRPVLVGSAGLGFVVSAAISYWPLANHAWVYGLLFFCLGLAAAGQNVGFAVIAEHVEPSMRATALGFNNAAITVFTTTIPPLVSYFIMRAEGARSHLVPSDFYTGFAFMPIMFLLALVLAALFVKETYCRPQKQAVPLAL